MNDGDIVLCDMQVVEFYYLANKTEALGNVTIEGWNNGHNYFCDDDRYHEIRTFKEFGENHDIDPVPGSQVPVLTFFNQGIVVGAAMMGTLLVKYSLLPLTEKDFSFHFG